MLVLAASACADPDLVVPTPGQVESYYAITARSEVFMNGNVAEIAVWQPSEHLSRGGPTWAKVGPYIYLFSGGTRDLFLNFNGLAAVRVRTRGPSGERVAEATLTRDALNDITWKRALSLAGQARVMGTERPGTMSELIRWGEDHTDYEYNPSYTRRR